MPKLPSIAIVIAAAAAAVPQAPAFAQAQGTTLRADVVKTIETDFDRTDTNNDGFIGRAELQAASAKALQKAQEQVQARAAQQFAALDKDKNGQLSLDEFKAAMNVRPNETPDQLLAKFDSNKDGRVSATEFRAPMLAAFDQADRNKDGKVTPEEAAAAGRR